MPNTPKDKIRIFVTRNYRFRARVEPLDGTPFEITVGGQNWNHGCARMTADHRRRIAEKCYDMHEALTDRLPLATGG